MSSSSNRTSKKARDNDAADDAIPSLNDRFALAGQVPNPLSRLRQESAVTAPSRFSKATGNPTAEMTAITDGEKVYAVPLDLIDPNPHNARFIYREERIREMAISLASGGQIVPAVATLRNGRYELLAGHYRFKGAKLASLPTLKLVLRSDVSDRQMFELSFAENNEREGQSALDNALAWRHALAKKLYASEAELAEANAISEPTVNKTLRILDLPPEVLEEVKNEPNSFGMSVLYALLQFAKDAPLNLVIDLAKKVRTGDASRRDIEEARAQLSKSPRTPRERARQYRIVNGKEQLGWIKDWDSGKVILQVQLEDPAKRTELVAELCKRFGLNQGEPEQHSETKQD